MKRFEVVGSLMMIDYYLQVKTSFDF